MYSQVAYDILHGTGEVYYVHQSMTRHTTVLEDRISLAPENME